MTMVSKYHPLPKVEERIKELFCETFARLKKKEEVNEFIKEFFSATEKIMFSKRLAIAVLLVKGYNFRAISRILKVSSPTIEKVNFWIKHSGKSFKKMVEKIRDEEKDGITWHNFWYAIESSTVGFSRGDWSARRKGIEKKHGDFKEKHVV